MERKPISKSVERRVRLTKSSKVAEVVKNIVKPKVDLKAKRTKEIEDLFKAIYAKDENELAKSVRAMKAEKALRDEYREVSGKPLKLARFQ